MVGVAPVCVRSEQRWPWLVAAGLTGVTVAVGLIQPRTLSALAPILLIALLVAAHIANGNLFRWNSEPRARPVLGPLPTALLAFFTIAMLSAVWSPAPLVSLDKSLVGASLAGLVIAGSWHAARSRQSDTVHLIRAIWIGFLIGAAYLAVEILTRQSVSVAVVNLLGFREGQINPAKFMRWQDGRLVAIDLAAMTRSMSAVVLLLPAALAAAVLTLRGTARIAAVGALLIFALIAIQGSDSQTAKLALITGFAAGIMALMAARWTRRILAAVWVVACLAIVPLALGAHGYVSGTRSLDEVLPGASPSVRLEILDAYAKKVLDRPMLGHGVNSSYVLGPKFDAAVDSDGDGNAPKGGPKGGMRQHPHNVYMQVWFELGAIGALAFMACGLAILGAIGRLPDRVQPFACATFASVATVLAPSYGMWQYWFMSAIALSAFATTLVVTAMSSIDERDLSSSPDPS